MNILSKSSYMESMPKQTNRQSSNNNRSTTWRILSFSSFLFLGILISSCEDPVPIFPLNETSAESRITSGIVMEDVVMRVSAPHETITRVEIQHAQAIFEIFEGCGESDCAFFVGNFPKGVYSVKVYSPAGELFTEKVIIE